MEIRTAQRKKAKIRLGLSAVSGGGKTYSALLIGKGLLGSWDKVFVIDTENNSADLYADLGDYKVLPLTPPFSPERFIEAIAACEKAGAGIIIIDSFSLAWEGQGGVLELADQLGGQYQSAWKQLTPRYEKLKQKILLSPCHMITTVRRKQDYDMVKGTDGKTKVQKVGLKEVTREGWEYDLTVNLELDSRHNATASKDRTKLFMDQPAFVPSEATGKLIREWCEAGVEVSVPSSDTIRNDIKSCHTVKELVGLYNANNKVINEHPEILELFTSRKTELNGKAVV